MNATHELDHGHESTNYSNAQPARPSDAHCIIKSIRTKSTTVRIMAISGGGNFGPLGHEPGAITTQAYLAAAARVGADEVLTKPFDKVDLLGAVRRLLGK